MSEPHEQELHDLRARLARLDPEADRPVAPLPARLKERAMTTTAPTPTGSPEGTPAPRGRRTLLVATAAAGVLAVAGVTTALVVQDDDSAPAAPPTTLALTAAPMDVMAMCLPVSADILKDAQVAFAGTVTAVDGTSATLDVTQWFRGGDADLVSVTQEGGADAVALDGVAFTQGTAFLVTANDGVVRSCSNSGPDTPELRSLFEQAFPG